MANNRLYLKCNSCGETLFLGKTFFLGFYWKDYGALNGEKPNPLEDRINKFYNDHAWCSGHCDGDYSIEYEDPYYTWIPVKDSDIYHWKCEGCGSLSPTRSNYCPNCGRRLEMEIVEKFVEFNEYCHVCKHKDVKETDDPCNECLTEPVNEYSHKPVRFEDAGN